MTDESDLGEWIESGQRKHRSVKLYARGDLIAEMDVIDRELQLGRRENRAAVELTELEAAWERLAEQFAASAMTFTIKGLTREEMQGIANGAIVENISMDETGFRLIQAQIVSPPTSVEQLRIMTERLGDPAIMRLAGVCNDANFNVAALTNKP